MERQANSPHTAGAEEGRERTEARPRAQAPRSVAIEVARATCPRQAVAGAVPSRLEIALTGEEYVHLRAARNKAAGAAPAKRQHTTGLDPPSPNNS